MFTQHILEESMDKAVSVPERSMEKYFCSHLLVHLTCPMVLPILHQSTPREHRAEFAQGCALVWVSCSYSTFLYCKTVSEDSCRLTCRKSYIGSIQQRTRDENKKTQSLRGNALSVALFQAYFTGAKFVHFWKRHFFEI